MAGYLVRRTLWAVLLFLVITFAVYVLFFVVPVDRSRSVRRTEVGPNDVRQVLNLKGPIYEEYGRFVWNVLHGKLGESFVNRESVMQIIVQAAPVTASLVFGGVLIWLLIAIPTGILSALRPRSLLDR